MPSAIKARLNKGEASDSTEHTSIPRRSEGNRPELFSPIRPANKASESPSLAKKKEADVLVKARAIVSSSSAAISAKDPPPSSRTPINKQPQSNKKDGNTSSRGDPTIKKERENPLGSFSNPEVIHDREDVAVDTPGVQSAQQVSASQRARVPHTLDAKDGNTIPASSPEWDAEQQDLLLQIQEAEAEEQEAAARRRRVALGKRLNRR